MFTGIIETVATIEDVREQGGVRTVHIRKPAGWKISQGQSIAVDGICSTVVYVGKLVFAVDYMHETLSKTAATNLVKGQSVNLERSLTLQAPLDGHMVQGHVDGVAVVSSIEEEGNSRLVWLKLPRELVRFAPPRGSIALNGVSLTIARVKGREIAVALIPHTFAKTNLGGLVEGAQLNVETDLLARYLDTLRA